ncbi:hypothetical protein rosag_47860 [Roseisolibacter agri]|uniref:Uncharacterized protein n=1 Tax=Roseisolibacter agri TaxID=2014610 RepID=A0AA37VD04_9BACT|nr:hypothetical protein rosag_47860 [Roseisolibacter agri]
MTRLDHTAGADVPRPTLIIPPVAQRELPGWAPAWTPGAVHPADERPASGLVLIGTAEPSLTSRAPAASCGPHPVPGLCVDSGASSVSGAFARTVLAMPAMPSFDRRRAAHLGEWLTLAVTHVLVRRGAVSAARLSGVAAACRQAVRDGLCPAGDAAPGARQGAPPSDAAAGHAGYPNGSSPRSDSP